MQLIEYLINFSSSIGSTILNVLLAIVEIIFIQIKFWIAVGESIYSFFFAQERDVTGDIVLITGAGHGMGKQLALQYSALGATVVCWDINEELNLETVKSIKAKGKKAFGYT